MTPLFDAVHVSRAGSFRLPVPPAVAFPAFSPEGERAWAPGWEPEYLYPRAGTAVPGLVFRTAAGGEATTWMLLQYDRQTWQAQYARIVPASRIGLVTVRCAPTETGSTDVHVRYELTGLSEAGNRVLEAFTEAAFSDMLGDWERTIAAVLAAS